MKRIELNPYHVAVQERHNQRAALSKEEKMNLLMKKRKDHAVISKQFRARRREFYESANKEGEVTF